MTSANLCKPIYDVINIPLPFALLNLESVERKGKSYKNFENEKSFLDEKKNIFHSF